MKTKHASILALGVAGAAAYFLLRPSGTSTAVTVRPAQPTGVKIGGVTVPGAIANPLISTGIGALTSWLTPSAATATPVPAALDQSTIDQINSGFLGFGRYGLVMNSAMPRRARGRRYF